MGVGNLTELASAGEEEHLAFSWQYFLWAIFIGFLSSVSLPLGSILGLQWQPSSIATGVMEAFGGGALLAALAVTMVAPISLGAADGSLPPEEQALFKTYLLIIVFSAMVGGVFFILLDELITRKGGELRKLYGQVRYYGVTPGTKSHVEAKKMRTLQSSSIFKVMSPEKQKELANSLKVLHFHENDVLFCKGDMMDRMLFVRKGTVELQSEPGQPYWIANPGDVLGITSILTGTPQQLTGIAETDVECLFVNKDWVVETMQQEPQLRYLMLKATYARLCVFMDVDAKLFEMRKDAREKMSQRFLDHIHEARQHMTETMLHSVTMTRIPISDDSGPGNDDDDDGNPFAEPDFTVEADHPSVLELPARKKQQQLDLLMDLARDGDVVQGDPEEVITQEVNSILYGDLQQEEPPEDARAGLSVALRRLSMPARALTIEHEADLALQRRASFSPRSPPMSPKDKKPQLNAAGRNPIPFSEDTAMSLERAEPPSDELGLPDVMEDSSLSNGGILKGHTSTVNLQGIDTSTITSPSAVEWRASGNTKGTAPLAVFLGILLDGIPESIVIGVHTQDAIRSLHYLGSEVSIQKVIPYTLIAGLFLSNFPEALASSMHMYKYGWGKPRILLMWSSIMLMTSVGAGLGYALANVLSEEVLYGVQGFAAGAMLTMIASSMIPEAVHLGGANFTGISVLMGFTAANLFQLLESSGH